MVRNSRKRILRFIGVGLISLVVVVLGLGFYLSDKIYLRDDHRMVARGDLSTRFTPEAIREDVDFLLATCRKIHPEFDVIGGDALVHKAKEITANLSEPMTRLEAYRVLAVLNRLILDGHTYLRAPDEERLAYESAGGLYPPFTVDLTKSRAAIDRSLLLDDVVRPGDRLVSLNGVDADDLARFSTASRSGESTALRIAYAERLFYRDLLINGISNPFQIEIERDGERSMIAADGLTAIEYRARRDEGKGRENRFEILDETTALLTFNDMPAGGSEFSAFLESGFAAMKKAGSSVLIIDLRENGGGDSRSGDALMAYLDERDLPSIDYIDVKVTEEIRAYYQTLLPPGFQWIPLHWFVDLLSQIQAAEPGTTFRLRPGPTEPTPRSARPNNAFDGEVYVLIGPLTYSSAVIFAAPLKHFGRATFVGEETGEPLIFFGENYYFDLPNTRLQAQVSHKKFVLVGAQDNRTGILPDLHTPDWANDAIPAALAVIAQHAVGGGSTGYQDMLDPGRP